MRVICTGGLRSGVAAEVAACHGDKDDEGADGRLSSRTSVNLLGTHLARRPGSGRVDRRNDAGAAERSSPADLLDGGQGGRLEEVEVRLVVREECRPDVARRSTVADTRRPGSAACDLPTRGADRLCVLLRSALEGTVAGSREDVDPSVRAVREELDRDRLGGGSRLVAQQVRVAVARGRRSTPDPSQSNSSGCRRRAAVAEASRAVPGASLRPGTAAGRAVYERAKEDPCARL